MRMLLSTLALVASLGFMTAPAMAACGGCDGCAISADAAHDEMVRGGGHDEAAAVGYGLGYRTPDFTLTDTEGKEHSLSDYEDKIVVLVFYNQDCPFVVEMWDRLAEFNEKYEDDGVVVLAVDPGVDKTPEALYEHAANRPYTILEDRSSLLALQFEATRTPEVFLHDRNGVVVYHGVFDTGRRGAEEGNRRAYTEEAVKALLEGREIEVKETRAFGCTIKWNPETRAAWEREQRERAEAEADGAAS